MFYWLAKWTLGATLRLVFRPRVVGLENVPTKGAAIIASNHLSFSDSFFAPLVIPGRKVMESASGIQKRDKRIARVRTDNGSGGAQISFQFKDGVPGYRVRLRKDYVEFLISAPVKSGDVSSMKGGKKSSHKTSHKKGAQAASTSSKKHSKKHHHKHAKK